METLLEEDEKISIRGAFDGLRMTKANFLSWQVDDEPFVYEFNNEILESKPGMKQNEAQIVKRIARAFLSTNAQQQGAELLTEFDCWVTESQMRRPDMAFYTDAQIRAMAADERQLPAFVIEVISEYDEFGRMTQKLREYFAAGVLSVWWVVPEFQMVYQFTSPKTVTIATDDDALSAAPALTDLILTANGIFQA
jgi:Uma2 family endonuclease